MCQAKDGNGNHSQTKFSLLIMIPHRSSQSKSLTIPEIKVSAPSDLKNNYCVIWSCLTELPCIGHHPQTELSVPGRSPKKALLLRRHIMIHQPSTIFKKVYPLCSCGMPRQQNDF
jgi:hypothetical protein